MNPRARSERERDEPPSRDGQQVDHRPRIALAEALTILTHARFPAVPAADFPVYAVGSVAGHNVIAPFALRQLECVKEEFTGVWSGRHHARIDSPAAGGSISAGFASR